MINLQNPNFTEIPVRPAIPSMYQRNLQGTTLIDVSVITPYFNTEEFFVDTFAVLQAQSLQNWEWVIVDDGSTDPLSVQRLAAVAAQDDRIKVLRQTNAGPGAARNTAFRATNGRYLCLLDSDDLVEPTYLEKCVWFLDSNPEFAFCNSYSVVFGDQNFLHAAGFERGKLHLQANVGPPISVIRRTAYMDSGGFDESIRFGHEDWDFWLALAQKGHWGYTLQEYLQWYRKRGGGRYEQIMRTGDVNAQFEAAMHSKYKGLENHFPEPTRRHPQPFELIETDSKVNNLLKTNAHGRRIMFLVPWMVTGGADRVNLELIDGLVGRGHDVTVCATLQTDHTWEHQFTRFTPDVFVLPNFLHQADYPRFLAYLIQSRSIDTVVVTGSTIGYQLIPFLRSVAPDVAFLDMCHVEEPHWLNGGHPRFGVAYQDVLDLNIVTTRHLAEWMQSRGADRSRIRVMYSGLKSQATQEPCDTNPQKLPVIIFAGRICEQKRPAMLAQILCAARDQGLEFRAWVVGDGELRPQLDALLTQYQLTNCVQMLGTLPHQQWLNLLSAADILLMPSQYEGISIALLEAIAAGVVPVVAKVGGQDEIVSPDAGFLVPQDADEIQGYLDALRQLISTPSLLSAMSTQCQAVSTSRLSWDKTIDTLLACMDEAHDLRLHQPRLAISPGLARELAVLALEYKRLGEAVDWLWRAGNQQTPTHPHIVPIPVNALTRIWNIVSASKLGGALIRSRRLRTFVQWLLTKLETRQQVSSTRQ